MVLRNKFNFLRTHGPSSPGQAISPDPSGRPFDRSGTSPYIKNQKSKIKDQRKKIKKKD